MAGKCLSCGGKQVGVHVIERVIILAFIVLFTSVAGFFIYLLVVWIVGRRRLHEPLTRQQLGIDLLLLAGGLGFLAFALLFVMFGQESHDIALPSDVAQGLKVAMIALGASSVAIVFCGVAILLADRFLHLPDRSV